MSSLKKIIIILFIGLVLRITVVVLFGDFQNNYYWEYGEIAKNVVSGKGYSLHYIKDSQLKYRFSEDVKPETSAYMPPGYVGFLIPFIPIENNTLRNALIYLVHIFFSMLTILLIFYLSKNIFNEKIAFLAAIIVSLLPEFLYANLSFTPTIIYHLLVVLLLFYLLKTPTGGTEYSYTIGIIFSIIIYFRSEFVLYALLSGVVWLFQKDFKRFLRIYTFVILLLSPWLIRNIIVFENDILLSSSVGINLYRGNNPNGIGLWGDEQTLQSIIDMHEGNIEVEMNEYYKREAISYIMNNPDKVIKNFFSKIYQHWFYNSMDKRTNNTLYLIPAIFVLFAFIYGISFSFNWSKYKFIYIFFIYSTIIVVVFFPMSRYQTMMKIMMIPFAAYGLYSFCFAFKTKIKRIYRSYIIRD